MVKDNVLHLKSETRQACPLSPLLFNIVLESLGSANMRKGTQFGKAEAKLSLFWDYRIIQVENPVESTKKQLQVTSKVAGYKINIHSSNEQLKFKKQYHLQ